MDSPSPTPPPQPGSSRTHRIQLYTTADYACSYLPAQQARSLVVAPGQVVDSAAYSQLVQQGFRRSGHFTYRPACLNCQACQSIRLPVAEFAPNRSQRRNWRNHQPHLRADILPPDFDEAHYALYQRYQQARHPGGSMAEDGAEQYSDFLLDSPVDTFLVAFYDQRLPQAQALRMVSIIDQLSDGLSAVYTFYDPEQPQAGYGTYGVLWQIALAQRLQLPYVYLGYWIGQSPKMRYKQDFRPHEILQNGQWQRPATDTKAAAQG